MTTTAVSHELIELAHDLARAVSEHEVSRLEELLAEEFTLQGAAGQLDRAAFVEAAAGQPELLKEAPHVRPVKRLDEVRAAKRPVVRYRFEQHEDPQSTGEARQLEAQKGV